MLFLPDGSRNDAEWRVASGEWRVASGEWRVASGEWRVASGEWRVARSLDHYIIDVKTSRNTNLANSA
ncbi:hypothetical protein [Photobacterium damselae]|uniref:hypothetical protein n=1 Tax=Photobacterium damselae TaxID=38293 RepID=UPI0015E77E19|nr:hypothetical protein [Photobacterium damselae]